ncbi:MAG TPA: aminotransferase class I/II-fold pyridoxal phosphate-dependent enzyme [Thermoanaerobaculia bacterium]|nr:aminotransferase class I/II-fold pyridoxal phosphate-dependent enzyme [Thermoanaerobaculia bacterium]
MSRPAHRVAGFGTSIFSEINQLATRFGAINLGQGAPNFDGPDFVKQAAVEAIRAGRNQYSRSFGLPELVEAIAAQRKRFYGQSFDPEAEVTVYAGATEALFCTFQAFCDPGDEVVLFEPFYDSYLAGAAMAGATVRAVTLREPGFRFDPAELAAAITPRTRLLLLNTPQNPTGRVHTRDELEAVAQLCCRHDLIAVSDEVYEHLVFEGEHLPLASLPGMRERTVTISSAGKTFSLTGWKIGWSCGPPELTQALRAAHQFVIFCQATPFQVAMAKALAAGDDYFEDYLARYRSRRDRLCRGLAEAGFGVQAPEGTYFVLADIRPLGFDDDLELSRLLPEQAGVAAIPASPFYLNKEHGRPWLRFAFCKDEETIDRAVERLLAWRAGRSFG